jgi:hypothetical protein
MFMVGWLCREAELKLFMGTQAAEGRASKRARREGGEKRGEALAAAKLENANRVCEEIQANVIKKSRLARPLKRINVIKEYNKWRIKSGLQQITPATLRKYIDIAHADKRLLDVE